MAIEFEDQDYDLGYCEGDPKLEEMTEEELRELVKLSKAQTEIRKHPREDHQDLASVVLLTEMYGNDLVVL